MMKKLLALVLLVLLSATQVQAQIAQDTVYFWKADTLVFKQSIKTANLDSITFKRPAKILVAPTVDSTTVTAITNTTATTGGNVTNDGGATVTARGVVWSITTNPTIALATKTVDGTGTGTFTSSLTGLVANTTYYVRAYATNSAGTSYGKPFNFTTTATINNPLGISMVAIPAGTFMMGSPTTEVNRNSDETQHSVTLNAFMMSTHEITCAQFAAFCNASNIEGDALWAAGPYPTEPLIYVDSDSTFGLTYVSGSWTPADGKTNAPMVNVTWFGAASFAKYAGGRLPTEAEWEYAARATTTTAFNTGACLSNTQANYNWQQPQTGCTNSDTNYPNTTQTVGTYAPNAWGLYDMQGNAWEWCSDWYGAYPTSAVTNPTGPTTGPGGVLRGGSWEDSAKHCRPKERLMKSREKAKLEKFFKGISTNNRVVWSGINFELENEEK